MPKPDNAPVQVLAAPAAPRATPENTPMPGGGSWRWSDDLPGWVDNHATPATPSTEPTPE